MQRKESLVDIFLNRFTYAKKLVFAIFTACHCPILLGVLTMLMVYSPIKVLKQKQKGLEEHTKLLALLASSSSLESIRHVSKEINKNASNNKFLIARDLSTYLLEDALIVRIPEIQALIQKIHLVKNGIDEIQNPSSHLIRWKKSLQNHLSHLYTTTYKEDEQIHQFVKSVDEYLISLQSDAISPTVEKNTLQSAKELEEGLTKALNDLYSSRLGSYLFKRYFALGAVLLAIFAIVLVYATRVIRKPLFSLRDAAIEFAKGNLSVRVPVYVNDEVGTIAEAFNMMAAFFEKIMIEAKQITNQMFENASKIYENSLLLESNFSRQKHSTHRISSQSQKIASEVQHLTNSFKEVIREANITSKLANLGSANLAEMDQIMQQMAGASHNIVSTLSLLKDHVSKINGVISAIVKIADQSNLLSLNTAIKAYKCGLQGGGFIIVADKIRELADQTAFGTLDIEQAVQDIVSVVSEAVSEVDKFSVQILSQVEQDKEFHEKLKKLISYTQEQMHSLGTMNQWIEDKSREAKKIHESILRLATATHYSTLMIKQLFNEVEILLKSTKNLNEATKSFQCSTDLKSNSPPISEPKLHSVV